ncbi:hypothetical protein K6Q96_04485 [Grimontia kaedaensis]|uniref:Lipoprotein n=1 Tax=Grimontia kaedaensis TaxID=2872157 RepID=A0ABY4WUK1_9GAMM|nr:hypothetical protein [Grimontia kaedaensis]USH03279.1 hypothetical protein K6Q96_04485 [Grimontia kaedaensis]
MKYLVFFPLFVFLLLTSGCSGPRSSIQANGAIVWSNGVVEKVRVSPSNQHLVFLYNSFTSSQVVVYSQIIGASTAGCEYYVNEPKPEVRLTICREGEVELLTSGVVMNVGQLTVYADH